MKDYLRRFNRGQSLVELALLLPAFLFLTLIVFDLGRGIYYYSVVYNAAREGARFAIVIQCPRDQACKNTLKTADSTGSILETAENLAVGLGTNNSNFFVVPQFYGVDNAEIRVTVGYIFKLVTPLANLIPSNGQYCGSLHMNNGEFCLTSTSTMSIER